jgi:hypothetical protein
MSRVDDRRIGLLISATIVVLAVLIAALPSIQSPTDLRGADALSIVPRSVVIGALLALPAVIGAIAAFGRSRPLFIAAGVLCLFQSLIAFSGVTLGFVLPALILISLGLRRDPTDPADGSGRNHLRIAGVLVFGLGMAAWIATLALTETVCWTARSGPDGLPIYERVPLTDTMTLGPGVIAGGCDGGSITAEGVAIGAILVIGAIAIAWLASARSGATR